MKVCVETLQNDVNDSVNSIYSLQTLGLGSVCLQLPRLNVFVRINVELRIHLRKSFTVSLVEFLSGLRKLNSMVFEGRNTTHNTFPLAFQTVSCIGYSIFGTADLDVLRHCVLRTPILY